MNKPFKRQFFKSLNSPHAAGAIAKKVWVCTNPKCETHHYATVAGTAAVAPTQCMACGNIEFLMFPSKTEAKHWGQLRMLERRGKIVELERQVRFPLLAYGPEGQPIRVGTYIADFTWKDVETGKRVIGDSKPKSGVDRFAALKLQIMEAMGQHVTLITGGIYS